MIANPDKFQAKIFSKNASGVTRKVRIHNNEIGTTKSVKFIIKLNSMNIYLRYVHKWQCS